MGWSDKITERHEQHVGLIYIAVPSKDVFTKNGDEWVISPEFLKIQAQLRTENPRAEFVSPSLQNYTFLKFMPEGTGADYATWRTRCRILLPRCDKILILPFKHWKNSDGVRDEIYLGIECNLEIELDKNRPEYGASPTEA
jgi:hypothetical protein